MDSTGGCSMHPGEPSAGICSDCGNSFCSDCLDESGRCPACREASERFLEGFAGALSRWEAGLRDRSVGTYQPGRRSWKKWLSFPRLVLVVLLGGLVAYSIFNLTNYNSFMGELYLQQGNLARAAGYLEKAAAQNPEDAGLREVLGTLYYEMGRYEKAVVAWRDCIALDSTNASAMNNLAWTYSQLGENLDRALELATRAVDREPENPNFLDTLAEIYYLKKEYYMALTYMRKALDQDPPNIEYYREKFDKIKKLAYGQGNLLEV